MVRHCLPRVKSWFLPALCIPLIIACAKKPLLPAQQREALPATFENDAKTNSYPAADWSELSPEKAGINREKLKSLEQYLFTTTGTETERKGIRTDVFVLVRGGNVVFERYGRNFHKNRKHLAWSVTKSFVNTLVGMAVLDNKLKIDEPAAKYYPPLAQPGKDGILIDHLLRMSSGLYWSEGYEASPLKSSVVAMLYTRGRNDAAAFAAAQDVAYPPGTHWYYSSGTSNILTAMVKNIYGAQFEDLVFNRLFKTIGMRFTTFEARRRGHAGRFFVSLHHGSRSGAFRLSLPARRGLAGPPPVA